MLNSYFEPLILNVRILILPHILGTCFYCFFHFGCLLFFFWAKYFFEHFCSSTKKQHHTMLLPGW